MEAGAADSSAAPPTGKRAVASVADERASVANSRPLHAAKRKCARVPHDGSKAYVCPKCKKEFESRQSLDYHYTSRPSWMVRSACPPCLASCRMHDGTHDARHGTARHGTHARTHARTHGTDARTPQRHERTHARSLARTQARKPRSHAMIARHDRTHAHTHVMIARTE